MDNFEFSNMSGAGVHEKILDISRQLLDGKDILVVGSGQGSFEYKLMKIGVSPGQIISLDIDPNKYKIEDVECKFCDLNQVIPLHDASVDICFAIEVIEHLNNPQKMIDEIYRVLRKNGTLYLSTPNLHSFMQKIRFLFTDNFGWFYEKDFLGSGHIHPIFEWVLKRLIKNKFQIWKYDSNSFHFRIFPKFPAIKIPIKHRFFAVNNIYMLVKSIN